MASKKRPQVVHTPSRSLVSREVQSITLDAAAMDANNILEGLASIGISLPINSLKEVAHVHSMDSAPALGGGATVPLQFLQTFAPGIVFRLTAARKIDQLIGMDIIGSWEDVEIVQQVAEYTGDPKVYQDFANIPLASWTNGYERRSVVRFEEGLQVGTLEGLRNKRVDIDTTQAKREAAALALEILRNRVGFYGYNDGQSRTYGFLNEPSLSPYVTLPAGESGDTFWSSKGFLEITADLRAAFTTLRNASGDTIDPNSHSLTLAISTNAIDFLSVTDPTGVTSVRSWLKDNYPNVRIESAPELNGANGGENVFYLYAEEVQDNSTDNGRVWSQMVQAKVHLVGADTGAKTYEETHSNAMAGVLLKRPYAVLRFSGV